jgi:hypothetical protein
MTIVSRSQDLDVLSAMSQCQLTISISLINDSDYMNSEVAELLAGRTLAALIAVDSVDIQAASLIAVSKILRHSKFSESYGILVIAIMIRVLLLMILALILDWIRCSRCKAGTTRWMDFICVHGRADRAPYSRCQTSLTRAF